MSGYIYVVRCDPGYVKIGYAKSPVKRLKAIRAGKSDSPADANLPSMSVIGVMPGSIQNETLIHSGLIQHRTGNGREWYHESAVSDAIAALPLEKLQGFYPLKCWCGGHVTIQHLKESAKCSKKAASFCALYRGSKRQKVSRAGGRPRKNTENAKSA